MTLSETIENLYDCLPVVSEPRGLGVIHPWIGARFEQPDERSLRVGVVGLNSYVGGIDRKTSPGWFRAWVRNVDKPVGKGTWRYYKSAVREATMVAEDLALRGVFPGRTWNGLDSLYVTNAVKWYLPEATSRRAHDVGSKWFEQGEQVWAKELDAMATHRALPHVVVVFGMQAWAPTWRPLRKESRAKWVKQFVSCDPASALFHRLNVVWVDEGSGERPMIVVRPNHPATPNRRWRAAELVGHPDFGAALRPTR